MKQYIVCKVSLDGCHILSVGDVFTDVKAAVGRAIVIDEVEQLGLSKIRLNKDSIIKDLTTFTPAEYWETGVAAAIFARVIN
jgi:hypothetical protein